ncbi:hypothetical protein SLEP1_g2859 [Rubroshorea leprosula]|uniref:ARM repeat superfamily protein n=1 Tax=Rubroshorea leprosula TaxID=152421 RepID=A0AAV5HS83_9ROSI|nr:hypothetical protein SLEP1_g2859 [Rubroshorea leprosula]
MGVISRTVFPACESLCFFCPALRTRSRHPVKRYKKMLAMIFPRSPDEQPNDRMINKLCEYASKNPLRIPKITSLLEQKFYKELRSEQFHLVKVVVTIYRKLLVSCKEQMPLFASSFLSIIHILLDQTQRDDIRILGCEVLFDFVNNQSDGTHMFNLDGMIPKLCLLAEEMGEDSRVQRLHSAGLKALSSMVWFMGEFTHIPADFDTVVSVLLENYEGFEETSDNATQEKQNTQNGTAQESFPPADTLTRFSWRSIVNEKGEVNVPAENAENPRFWSRVCLHNMAKLAKEATTVRRVLESLFRAFDNEDLWPLNHGVALSVLQDMQLLIEKFGENTHFLLSILIKHLDHKNVLKKPSMQLDIVKVATSLARQTKVQSSVPIIGALSDMTRHLRKSIHISLDDSNLGDEMIQYNQKFRAAVDDCLVQLSLKVGDAGPVLDMMAVMLENMPNITLMARTLISAVYRTAQIMASVPNLYYQNKAFPEALFHQLLVAMVFADHETRVGAHRIFSVVLVPSSVCPRSQATATHPKKKNMQKTLSRTVSVFSSSAALFHKLGREHHLSQEDICIEKVEKGLDNKPGNRIRSVRLPIMNENETSDSQDAKSENTSILNRLKSSYSRTYSVKKNPSTSMDEEEPLSNDVEVAALPLRLSSHQITLMLSSIWAQSIFPSNTPENFEAIAHTYSLVLLFARTKNSFNEALIRGFQLAFSLRNISLGGGGPLQPSRRRSLFTLATSMIIFLSKAYNIPPLVPCVKALLTDRTVDPFLQLVDDCKLQAVDNGAEHPRKVYGSKEDDEDASKSLSAIEITENQSKESLATMVVKFLGNLSEKESSSIRKQLLNDFIPDDACPLGTQLFSEKPGQIYQPVSKENESPEKVEHPLFMIDDDVLASKSESQVGADVHLALQTACLLSVDELLNAVSETTNQVGRFSSSATTDMPYSEMAGHCEALLAGKQQKMSAFMSAQQSLDLICFSTMETQSNSNVEPVVSQSGNPFADEDCYASSISQSASTGPSRCAAACQYPACFFQLPASSPYDNFLKAAGC